MVDSFISWLFFRGFRKEEDATFSGKNAWTRRKSPVKYPIFHVTSDMREKKIEKMSSKPSGFLCCPYFYEMRRVMMRTSASHIAPYCPWKCVSLRTSCLTSMWKLHGPISSKENLFVLLSLTRLSLYFIATQGTRRIKNAPLVSRPNSKSLIVQVEYSFTFTVRVLI